MYGPPWEVPTGDTTFTTEAAVDLIEGLAGQVSVHLDKLLEEASTHLPGFGTKTMEGDR